MKRRSCRMLLWPALLLPALAAAQGGSGVFFFAASPTHANETLLLLGGNAAAMLGTAQVRLCSFDAPAACALLPNVQRSDASAKVVLPADLPLAVFTAAACDAGGACAAPSQLVNAPRVAWQQADAGAFAASQGGSLRLFGSALAFAGGGCVPTARGGAGGAPPGVRVRLAPTLGGAPLELPLTFASCYALSAGVPADAPAGSYTVQVANGLSAAFFNASAAPTTVAARAAWPAQVFNVAALGSVWAALEAARANGGGVVYFPRGRYAFDENRTLNAIPPFTTLQGEGTDLVELYWRDMAGHPSANGSPTSLVQGVAGNFALRNCTLFVQGNFSFPVISDGSADNVTIAGVIVRANPYYMMLEPVNQSFHGRSMPVGSGFNSGAAVSVSGCNWAVVDSDLLGGSHAIDIFISDSTSPTWFRRPCNGLLARSKLVGGFGQYRLEGAQGVIIEDNFMSGGGLNSFGSWVSTYYAKATEFIYLARNTIQNVMGGDRELLSFDGGGGAYLGGVASTSADGRTLTLAGDPTFAGYIPPGPRLFNYTEAAVCVLEGAGKGQVGRVVRNDFTATNRSWELRAPFAVPLDGSSLLSIVPFRGDVIITGNAFSDGGAIQLYAMAIGVSVSENTAVRASGFLSWGLNPHNWGVQPNFYTIFINNTVAVGNAWGGQTGGFATVSANDQGNITLNRGVVFRGNAALNNAPFSIGGSSADVVVEANHVAHNDVGISVSNATTTGVWLRGNTFEDVAREVVGFVSYAPGLSCCCNGSDALTGVAVVVKPFASYAECGEGSCEAKGQPDPW